MIVLDENISNGQRLLLEGWKFPVRQIGQDIGRKGLADEEIIVLLRRLRNATFVSRDSDFWSPGLRNARYALVVIAAGQYELASFVRRLMRHSNFNTHAKRAGKVIRASPAGIAYWGIRRSEPVYLSWET